MTRPTLAVVHTIRGSFAPSSIAALLAQSVAVVVVALESPAALRIPAMIVLLLIPGAALVRLLTGPAAGASADRAVRLPLSVLLGILLWLAVALLLDAFGIALRPPTLALGAGITGLALLVLAGVARRPARQSSTPQAVAARTTKTLRSAVAVAGAALVIVAAACGAAMMLGKPVERYTTLGFVDSKPFTGEIPAITQGQTVRLNWVLRGVGCIPSSALTSVRLTVDGDAVGDIAVDIDGDADQTLTGAVTFTAPIEPGRHTVELAVLPAAGDGTPLPEPGYVSTFLEVDK
ncbi:hypothetical protein [Mycobacterium sp. AZCC_0083]|uniref:hypothetical protein n=1 Tax=Mycobacterium sp. AZCC_0083 TaxID=2735882 RepID=UPI0016079B99|nr:hypothetical protein [Mycobacterium sp. AZCC_0083]MBB5163307.1 hypothetical protein [Mycobacterium sp. AZCC_0083]